MQTCVHITGCASLYKSSNYFLHQLLKLGMWSDKIARVCASTPTCCQHAESILVCMNRHILTFHTAGLGTSFKVITITLASTFEVCELNCDMNTSLCQCMHVLPACGKHIGLHEQTQVHCRFQKFCKIRANSCINIQWYKLLFLCMHALSMLQTEQCSLIMQDKVCLLYQHL